MIHKGTERVYTYWQQRRSGKNVPSRDEIAPSGISADLHSTFLLECSTDKPSSSFCVRLAGTRLCTIFGHELRDVGFQTLFQAADQNVTRQCIDAVRLERMVIVFELTGRTAAGRDTRFECMLLPLSNRNPQMILGTLNSLDAPLWLGTDPVDCLDIDSLRVIDHEKELFCLQNRPAIPLNMKGSFDAAKTRHGEMRKAWTLIQGSGEKPKRHKMPNLQVFEGGRR